MRRVGVEEWLALAGPIMSGRLVRYGQDGESRTDRFETKLARHMGAQNALAVSSGTSALICALAAAGVGPGDEVLVPAYTWVATAAAVLAVGAVPVLVEIDETLTLDPNDIEPRLSPDVKAILVVHMGNTVANMDAITAIAAQRNLIVLEDACQAVGVSYKGRKTGTIGAAGALSFNAYKNMSSAEGGAVLTNDPRLIARARIFHDCGDFGREHGHDRHNEPAFVGQNYKANELQAAMLDVQLRKLNGYIRRLKSRRALLARLLAPREDCIVSPHNDVENACSLTLLFPTQEGATAFAGHRGVARVLDNSKHVFTNWRSIQEQRAFHPRMNPWAWSNRPHDYSASVCPRTLDIMARTCRVGLGADMPLPVVAAYGRWLAARPSTKEAGLAR